MQKISKIAQGISKIIERFDSLLENNKKKKRKSQHKSRALFRAKNFSLWGSYWSKCFLWMWNLNFLSNWSCVNCDDIFPQESIFAPYDGTFPWDKWPEYPQTTSPERIPIPEPTSALDSGSHTEIKLLHLLDGMKSLLFAWKAPRRHDKSSNRLTKLWTTLYMYSKSSSSTDYC